MENKNKTLEEYHKQIKLREKCNKIIERNTKMERDLRDSYTDLMILLQIQHKNFRLKEIKNERI